MAVSWQRPHNGYLSTQKATTKGSGYVGKQKKTEEPLKTCRICGQKYKGNGNTCPSCYEFIVQKAKEGR